MTIGKNIFIVGAKRTPFGSFGGSLKHLSPTELGVISTKAALAQSNLDAGLVDAIYFGNVISCGNDAAYLARHIGLKSGMRMDSTALTVNRLCGSGFETVIQGAQAIQLGEAGIVVCGGTESMSRAPMVTPGEQVRFGVNLGSGIKSEDSLWSGLTDAHAGVPMGITAENLADKYGISRQQCDEFAIRSQQRWGKANGEGIFEAEIAPIEVKDKKKGKKNMTFDEHARPDSVYDKIASLKPVFKKDGVVTAANASGISDGSGSIILASEEAVKEHGLKPLCRLASYHISGCDPTIMGIGPVASINAALQKAKVALSDVERVEVNEAFAAQYLAVEKELGLDPDKSNIHGGAIAIGHPLAASGSRITAHLSNALQEENIAGKYFIGSACIGGGQGIAVLLESV